MGIKSKITTIQELIANQLISWNRLSSTLRGRLNILKTYCLSRQTFHFYINQLENSSYFKDQCAKFVYNTSCRWTIKNTKAVKKYELGGVELWDLEIRSKAQLAWTYERYIRSLRPEELQLSFSNIWSVGGEIKEICKEAWLELFTNKEERKRKQAIKDNPQQETFYREKVQLKQIYSDLMAIKYPDYNQINSTPTQLELIQILGHQLPFIEVRQLINIKGRDLMWRYLLKAIPKVYREPCINRNEEESSEHIFFSCKQVTTQVESIINEILIKSRRSSIKWNVKVFSLLADKFTQQYINNNS